MTADARRADLQRGAAHAVPQRHVPGHSGSASDATARSCWIARSAGRAASGRARAATPDARARDPADAVLHLQCVEGDHGDGRPPAARARAASTSPRGLPSIVPEFNRRSGLRHDHRRSRALTSRRHSRSCRASGWISTTTPTLGFCGPRSAASTFATAPARRRPITRSRVGSSSARSSARSRAPTSRPSCAPRSSTRWASGGRATAPRRTSSTWWRMTTRPGHACCHLCHASSPACSACRSRSWCAPVATHGSSARRRAGRQRRLDRERAVPLHGSAARRRHPRWRPGR